MDITITFDVEGVGPDEDPLDVAGQILDIYNSVARQNGGREAGMNNLSAEWEA